MIKLRKSDDRGTTHLGWLDSRHSFSFGRYIDRDNMGFRSLRVINDDDIAPGGGFGTHPHDNMEILSYIVEGSIEHRDSMGNGSIVPAGELQKMTAGSGITHSEFNPSNEERLRLLQIWITPETRNLKPSYEQRALNLDDERGSLKLIASRDGRDNSLSIAQDVSLYAGRFDAGQEATLPLAQGRHAWMQVISGSIQVAEQNLTDGDALAISDENSLSLIAESPAEVLFFDLA